jgi:hypothetical protein
MKVKKDVFSLLILDIKNPKNPKILTQRCPCLKGLYACFAGHPLSCTVKKSVLKIQEYIHEGANLKFYIPEFFNFKLLIPDYSPI